MPEIKTDQSSASRSRWTLAYLLFTAMLCGALIMVVEVLGSRVIGPFFGVSLFIWTSLIAVTLVSLSLGYAVGGYLADRRSSADYLFGIIFLAGVAVLLIPLFKAPVLSMSVPLGLRLGSLVSTALLFGPSLFLLGCVSPYLVKIATREMDNIGKTVGGLYSVSTIGSVLGTALTGFVLIAYMGVNSIFLLVGTLLVILAVAHFVIVRRMWWAPAALAVPLLLPSNEREDRPSVLMENGTRATLLASHDSHYGNLKVVEYSYGNHRNREMIIDGLIQGGVEVADGQSIYAYSYYMQFLPYAIMESIDNCLVIGMGAGVIPSWYQERGVRTDVVDIDPAVFAFAQNWFGVDIQGEKVQQDARYFLQTTTAKYDVAVLDVFSGDTTPAHLLSKEAVDLLAQRLTPEGVLAVNLVADLKNDTFMTASVIKTLAQVFDNVVIYPTFDPGQGDGQGNIAILAYQGPKRVANLARLAGEPISRFARNEVLAHIGREFAFPAGTRAIVLTDDYNPIDFFDAKLRESVRDDILDNTAWDILIYSG